MMDWIMIEFFITIFILTAMLFPLNIHGSTIIRMLGLPLDSEQHSRTRRRVIYLTATCIVMGAAFTHACHLVVKMSQ